jgi:hypothetical protein
MSNFFGRIRIIPRQSSFLDRISGSSGQIYTNKDSGSIRVYNGDDPGGKELATSDFKNIESTAELDLLSKKNRIRFHWDTLNDLETEVDPLKADCILHMQVNGHRLLIFLKPAIFPTLRMRKTSCSGSKVPGTLETI